MRKLNKFFSLLLVLLMVITCLSINVYAEEVVEEEAKEITYKIDNYVTEDIIENENYFEENNTLNWLNDLVYTMQLTSDQFETLEEFETYIKENYETLNPYKVHKEIIRTNELVLPKYRIIDLANEEINERGPLDEAVKIEIPSLELDLSTIEQALLEDQLVILVVHYNEEPHFYIVHSIDENNKDVLLVSTVGIFNIYKQKVNLNQLIAQCTDFTFYNMTIPEHKVYPLPDWSSRTYSSPFGMRIHPITGQFSMHTGLDIGATMGTDVYAVQSGVVTVADSVDDSSSGCWVEILHDDGYITRYLHASKVYVKVGQRVEAGDVIMAVGSTGASTGPHLHFCYMLDGKYLEPAEYLASIIM